MANPCALVRETCRAVVDEASHVTVELDAVARQALALSAEELERVCSCAFDAETHVTAEATAEATTSEDERRVCQYCLAVDAINFCFWPDADTVDKDGAGEPPLEYEHVAGGFKRALADDPGALDANRLASIDGPSLRALLGRSRRLPAEDERARLLREVGAVLLAEYGGEAAQLVAAAGRSATRLVALVAEKLPGFRDHAVWRGRQVFLYKRTQIFVGDVYGALGGSGIAAFTDLNELTTFPDYRVPVVLRKLGLLRYSAELAGLVDSKAVIPAGSEMELEIRAATVVAVEALRDEIARRVPPPGPTCVSLDWYLWEEGEKTRAEDVHHRTRSIFY